MSELAQIQKALEESQSKLQGFDEQKKQIEQNGTISKQLQDDMAKVNEEMTKTGQRLFDLEQRLSSGPDNPGKRNPSQNVQQKSWLSPGMAVKVTLMRVPLINHWEVALHLPGLSFSRCRFLASLCLAYVV
jgi:septal ring factor EnvC (AmiA/AmiB activator)